MFSSFNWRITPKTPAHCTPNVLDVPTPMIGAVVGGDGGGGWWGQKKRFSLIHLWRPVHHVYERFGRETPVDAEFTCSRNMEPFIM